MANEKLLLQQYLDLHPIMYRNKKYRIAYVSLIKYLCNKNAEDSQWGDSMLNLMREKIMENEEFLPVTVDSNNAVRFGGKKKPVLKHKFQKYRYNILTDCLFFDAFSDRKRGKTIFIKVCNIFPKNKSKLIRLFENFYKVNLLEIKKDFPMMEEIYELIARDRAFLEKQEKRIMITANMSAGKSTLLNALAGKKVNKTQNDTCTAKLHYLYNKAGEDNLSYELDHDLVLNASREILMEDNVENNTLEIVVGTRFRSLSEIDKRICFIDTPGVNSSQNKEHRELTSGAISDGNCDLLIFLLNGENIGTDDDIKHLRYVAEKYSGKILFLVNKLDRFKKEVDSVPGTLEKIKEDLVKLGFEKSEVYPISAYAGYLAKMALFGEELTDDEMDDMDFRKRKLSRDEFRYDKYFDIPSAKIDETNDNEVLLRNSGILAVEQLIYN